MTFDSFICDPQVEDLVYIPTKVDFIDTVIVNLKVSPRELKLMCDALIESDRYMCQEGKLNSADLRRWDAILDHIKEKAFNDAY